jgi:hypothetical protein
LPYVDVSHPLAVGWGDMSRTHGSAPRARAACTRRCANWVNKTTSAWTCGSDHLLVSDACAPLVATGTQGTVRGKQAVCPTSGPRAGGASGSSRILPLGAHTWRKTSLREHANHHAFLSLPSWEIALGLHDTAQIEPTRPGSVGREGPGTLAQVPRRAAEQAGEGPSSARARRAGAHSDSGGPPREPPGARRRGRRVPFARRRNSPQPGS